MTTNNKLQMTNKDNKQQAMTKKRNKQLQKINNNK